MKSPSRVAVLGATGTIGRNALDVIARHPGKFQVAVLTAQRDAAGLAELCARYQPARAVIGLDAAEECRQRFKRLDLQTELLAGAEALCEAAAQSGTDQVIAGIVGAAGLAPTLAAVRAGKRVLLANKEPLVMAGALFMRAVKESGAVLLPLDSEHNAVFQCLPPGSICGAAPVGVRRIWLTASGGPFRNTPLAQLSQVTVEDALKHPNWRMGPKISIDSATMMNKGLEIIEAAWLFGLSLDQIAVVLHPQSTIHALVEYVDGSWLAQLGQPDMRTPIAQALAWPERIEAGVQSLDLLALSRLDFTALDDRRYPCFVLAQRAAALGGLAPAALNAANEVAVDVFLAGRIHFTQIAVTIERLLDLYPGSEFASASAEELPTVLACDAWARTQAQTLLRAAA